MRSNISTDLPHQHQYAPLSTLPNHLGNNASQQPPNLREKLLGPVQITKESKPIEVSLQKKHHKCSYSMLALNAVTAVTNIPYKLLTV